MSHVLDHLINREYIVKQDTNAICVSPLPGEVGYKSIKFLFHSLDFIHCIFQFSLMQFGFFRQFGEIKYVGFDHRFDRHPVIGFVEFQSEYDSIAKDLIAKGQMEIEDKIIQVKSYTQYKREYRQISASVLNGVNKVDNATMLQEPPLLDSPQNLLNALDDDCLIEIFRKFHLSTLNTVANVCTRFQRIAQQVFSIKHQWKIINILDLTLNRKPALSQVENFLSNFGPLISAVTNIKESYLQSYYILQNEDINIHLKIICKYCTHLKHLEFNYGHERLGQVQPQTLYAIRPLLERLKSLKIVCIPENTVIFDVLSVCLELETLEMDFIDYTGEVCLLPKNAMPKLVAAHFFKPRHFQSQLFAAITKFFELNLQLNVLTIPGCALSLLVTSGGLNNLNELNIAPLRIYSYSYDLHQNDYKPLEILSSTTNLPIKNIKLELINFTIDNDFLRTISQIKFITALELRLHPHNLDALMLLLQKLPHLTTVEVLPKRGKLFQDIRESQISVIKKIIHNAHNQLSKIIFFSCHTKSGSFRKYPIDHDNYYDILESVKKRNSCKLTFIYKLAVRIPLKNTERSQSLYILDMVPDLLTVKQQTHS